MTNRQVIGRFAERQEGKNRHLTSTGDKLFSYSTVIGQWVNGDLCINETFYSVTTSRHRNLMKWLVGNVFGGRERTFRNVPIEVEDLLFVEKS